MVLLPQQVRFSVWEESWDNPKYVEKSKSGVAQQKENTRRWLREWDINHTGKRKSEKEKCLHRKKSLWRPQALTWGASFTTTSHCTQFYKTGYDTFVPACSGDKASNNSDAYKNYKSGGPSAIATASREWLLFKLFFFYFKKSYYTKKSRGEEKSLWGCPPPLEQTFWQSRPLLLWLDKHSLMICWIAGDKRILQK